MKKILLFFIVFTSINLYSNNNAIVPDPLLSSVATVNNITCNGSNDGSITITTTGGQAPYSYSINGGTYVSQANSTTTFTGLPAGTYLISTKDALGNTNDIIILLAEPVILNATAGITKPLDCISDATVTVTATGGVLPYSYSRDNGITFVSNNIFTNLTFGTYSFYVKDSNGCIATIYIIIEPLKPLIITATSLNISCKGDNSGTIAINAQGGQAPYTYSIGKGPQTSNVFTNLSAGIYNATITDSLGCLVTMPTTISEPATSLIAIFETKDQSITINATGGTGEIKYSISPNSNTFTTNNTFTDLAPGEYETITQDENGCFLISYVTINPPAPLVNGKKIIDINFTQGQTLADIKIDVPNIKWYTKSNASTGKMSKTTETALPLTTVLTNNTTYYASQTINGIESTERLAVTTKLGTLGTNDFNLTNFSYYPNPVKNVLMISNSTAIDEITLTTIKGENILTKKINAQHSEIDLSNISKGVYFLKVKSEGKERTVKLLKE